MRNRLSSLYFVLLFLCGVLASCGVPRVGTIPRGTPDTGDGTPAVVVTPTPDLSKVPKAASAATGTRYAFVRQNQLWLSLTGGAPASVTHFDYAKAPNVFWHRPLWSTNDIALSFIVSAQPDGVGGGGCGSAESGSSGALYVLDPQTKQLLRLSVGQGAIAASLQSQPPVDQWQYTFWEDTTHLLAWYNGDAGKMGAAAGLYRYSLVAHTLQLVVPLSALGAVSLPSFPKANTSLLLSLRYSSGQLFYQVVAHPFEQQSELVIYRHSVTQPGVATVQVLSQGREPWCSTDQAGVAYSQPGWDVSKDGEQVVSQMILSGALNQGVANIQVFDLKSATKTQLFAQLDSALLAHDLALTWAPDNQTVVASEAHPIVQRGPFSASLANPDAMQQYSPDLSGQPGWRADGTAFVLQKSVLVDDTDQLAVYLFLSGDAQGRLLLTDAQEFSWG